MASLRDIADEVGVSISLVSRVLNNRMGSTGVRPELAERIRASAAAMNYLPNPAAVALSGGRQNVLGIFIHRIGIDGSGTIERTIEGVSLAARANHQRLLTSFYTDDDDFQQHDPIIRKTFMDGLLLVGIRHPELVSKLLSYRERGLPIATLHDEPIHDDLPNAGLDQIAIGRLTTEHLIERGCRRIVFACVRGIVMEQRITGYRKALRHAGLVDDPELLPKVREQTDQLHEEYGPESGRALVAGLLERGVTFDGVIAQSDAQAIGVINELAARRIDVPGQVRVIGMDNSPHCLLARVPLSSISGQLRERASTAIHMLLQLIRGEAAASVNLQPRLIARESTA